MLNLSKIFDVYPTLLIFGVCAMLFVIARDKKFKLNITDDKNILNTIVFLFAIFVLGAVFCGKIKDSFQSCCPLMVLHQ